MQWRYVSVDNTECQKCDVLVKLVEDALQSGLLLDEAIFHKKTSRMKCAY